MRIPELLDYVLPVLSVDRRRGDQATPVLGASSIAPLFNESRDVRASKRLDAMGCAFTPFGQSMPLVESPKYITSVLQETEDTLVAVVPEGTFKVFFITSNKSRAFPGSELCLRAGWEPSKLQAPSDCTKAADRKPEL